MQKVQGAGLALLTINVFPACVHFSLGESGLEIGLESLRTDRIFLFLRAAMAMIVWNEPGNLGS